MRSHENLSSQGQNPFISGCFQSLQSNQSEDHKILETILISSKMKERKQHRGNPIELLSGIGLSRSRIDSHAQMEAKAIKITKNRRWESVLVLPRRFYLAEKFAILITLGYLAVTSKVSASINVQKCINASPLTIGLRSAVASCSSHLSARDSIAGRWSRNSGGGAKFTTRRSKLVASGSRSGRKDTFSLSTNDIERPFKPCSYELASSTREISSYGNNSEGLKQSDSKDDIRSYEAIHEEENYYQDALLAITTNSNLILDGEENFDVSCVKPGVANSSATTDIFKCENSKIGGLRLEKWRRAGNKAIETQDVNHRSSIGKKTEFSDPQQTRGGAAAAAAGMTVNIQNRPLLFWENMVCGAISRSIAQTIMHPANTMKTILQSNRNAAAANGGPVLTIGTLAHPKNLKLLTRGAGAQFVMSVPHGAVNFAVLEFVRKQMSLLVQRSEWMSSMQEKNGSTFGPTMDFMSSAISTVACSVVSTPQMMITDNIMAGTYPNLVKAFVGLGKEKGVMGFYSGWWPGLAGKIPSYAKRAHLGIFKRSPKDIENSIMGCLASATTVCVMIPMDTIKTRLVTQMNYPDLVPYKGIADAAVRISREEGIGAFYRGLTPRLISVVPMIGIQFGVYEFMKKVMVARGTQGDTAYKRGSSTKQNTLEQEKKQDSCQRMEEVMMEVAADDDQPFPAPVIDGYGSKWKLEKKVKAYTGWRK